MANALRLEQMLHAGQFRSLADIRMTYGITRMACLGVLFRRRFTEDGPVSA